MGNQTNVISLFLAFFVVFVLSFATGIYVGTKLGGGEQPRIVKKERSAPKQETKRPKRESKEPVMEESKPLVGRAQPTEERHTEMVERPTKSTPTPIVKPQKTPSKTTIAKKPQKKTENKKVATLPTTSEKGKYTVQIGSFTLKELAERRRKDLLSKGYPAFIKKSLVADKGIWYRVRIGTFNTRDEAKKYGEIIKTKEGSVDTVFITFNN